jgi:hypothetical protein
MFRQLAKSLGILPSVFDRENFIVQSYKKDIAVGILNKGELHGRSALRADDDVFLMKEFKKDGNCLHYKFEKDASFSLCYEPGRYSEYKLEIPSLNISDKDVIPLRENSRYQLLGSDPLDHIWELYNPRIDWD